MDAPIYLDNHSTTRCDPRVLEVMLPYFSEHYGNAASKTHAFGWRAEAAVDLAREQVAECLGAATSEIVFCSGATEANNLAIRGVMGARGREGKHVVTVATEHPSVLDSVARLEREGYRVTRLPVDAEGLVDPASVESSIGEDTVLLSVMLVNNEIGVVQPVAELAPMARARGVLVHCDAVQALGTMKIDVESLGVDLLTVSAHKVYGPKGIGALWMRRRPRVAIVPLVEGGGHERGLRAGTLAVPLIVGLGEACRLLSSHREEEALGIAELRDRLWQGLSAAIPGIAMNGSATRRVAGNLNVAFEGIDAEALVASCREIAVSTGSACASAAAKPSHVLAALGPSDLSRRSVRFGVGRFNTIEDIDRAVEAVARAVAKLRGC